MTTNNHSHNKIIIVPKKVIVPIIAIAFLMFITLIYIDTKVARNYKKADYKMKIEKALITGKEGYGSGRGVVFYKENHFISTSSKYISSNCNFDDWKGGPLLKFNSEPYKYRLFDLRLPYSVFKKKNNDTLIVEKDSCTLKFKLD